jgi:hypothetical protein
MPRIARRRLLEIALILLVLVVSLALLTPWGLSHRRALEPKLALAAIVLGSLSCAGFVVSGLSAALSGRADLRTIVISFCIAASSFLLVATFVWAAQASTAQTVTLVGAAVFMIAAAVLQLRARGRSSSL